MSIEKYIQQFSHLRTDINRNRWTPATYYHAPHKPFLLLSVLDLFAQGFLQTNFISIGPELGDLFAHYWGIGIMENRRGNLALPFFHLRSSAFWHLIPQDGKEAALLATRQIDTLSQLQALILGASLDEELFQSLKVEETRNVLRTILIETYFGPVHHSALLNQGAVNIKAYLYSQHLIKKVHEQIREDPGEGDQYQAIIRDQGFRRAVVRVYDHRCALCGVRMLTTEGHSVVDAAHIIPWSVSHNDDLGNGMALCCLCHWTFDEGMVGISPKYTILLSAELRTSLNFPGIC